MSTPVIPWQAWAPPLDPPTPGGLPLDQAQAIADATWADDPHLCAALQWEAYAAMLPPTPAVSQVATGAQTVSYTGGGAGPQALALQQAAMHRSFTAGLVGVPMATAPPPMYPARSYAQAGLSAPHWITVEPPP